MARSGTGRGRRERGGNHVSHEFAHLLRLSCSCSLALVLTSRRPSLLPAARTRVTQAQGSPPAPSTSRTNRRACLRESAQVIENHLVSRHRHLPATCLHTVTRYHLLSTSTHCPSSSSHSALRCLNRSVWSFVKNGGKRGLQSSCSLGILGTNSLISLNLGCNLAKASSMVGKEPVTNSSGLDPGTDMRETPLEVLRGAVRLRRERLGP
jgi:hypothetical protein